MTTTILAPNPLSADIDWDLVASTLNVEIVPALSQREVVGSGRVSQGEADLLGAVRQEMDGLGESPDCRVGVVLEWHGSARGLLAVLDALKDEVASGQRLHGSSPDFGGRSPKDGAAGAADAPAAPGRGQA